MEKKVDTWTAYQPQVIEEEWQKTWENEGLYQTREDHTRQKMYCLDYFPYPSGEGLHVGHCRNYVPTDVITRFKRMQGFNVLHPMGWDAFGEPTEQHAIAHNIHPRLITDHNTSNFRRQLNLIGTSYDWSREIDSSHPDYYRWTQYFFIRMFQRGLAYRDDSWQWWCTTCQTTLSSHEAVGGICWRGHPTITRRRIPAWYFRITAYADELLSGLDQIDWPEPIKTMQRNWIGRSEGCEIDFSAPDGTKVSVFTTRPDTLFGVTYLVLAPEHPQVSQLATAENLGNVQAYIEASSRQSEIERMLEDREKTGVQTGGIVINPINGEEIPVWVADYVLPGYGTGAVMGVPAHDVRDYKFANQYGLPVRQVVAPEEGQGIETPSQAFIEPGILVHSGPYSGMSSEAAAPAIAAELIALQAARSAVQYRMRDWLISRQRYWGTPIPIVYCDECGVVPVSSEQLPVLLPSMADFRPDGSGRSPLGLLPGFVNTACPVCQGSARRETDTMGGFACSSWYFLRFTSPQESSAPFQAEAIRYWMPVDLYVGGAEHAVLHLLYARFWTKFLADEGLVDFREPFIRLRNQGQLSGNDGQRMSKSRGNVITPDEVVASYGADALRLYVMFIAPFDQDVSWSVAGIHGTRRFLNRVWTLYADTFVESTYFSGEDSVLECELHRTIQKITERIEEFRLNTLVSALMEFTNLLYLRWQSGAWQSASFHQALECLLRLLAPAAPYIAEELWHQTGHSGSIHQQSWPEWEAQKVDQDWVEIPIQVNGKLRAAVRVPPAATQEQVILQARAQLKVEELLKDHHLDKVIYLPGKVLNFVVHGSKSTLGTK